MPWLDFCCRHRFSGGFELELSFALTHRFVALFGPSGSGKTTVLSLIAGFLRPGAGQIRLGEEAVLDTRSRVCLPPEQRRVGMVFQDSLLFPHLTVEANLRYGRRHRRNQRRTAGFARVAEVLELGPLLRRYPGNLSGGERQRVALGRALLSGAEVLLMDEPMASLDAGLRDRVLAYVERVVAEWDIPVLYVTHAQVEVRRVAEWVVVIDRGRLVAAGTPEDALGQPSSLDFGDATGPMNLLRLDAVEPIEGRLVGRLGDQTLFLPPAGAVATPAFVQCSPDDVILSRTDVAGLSARNHLRGRIRQIVPLKRGTFVAVDIGQILWVEVTPQAVLELQLAPGDEVVCLLKAHSLKLLG